MRVLSAHRASISCVAFSPDGTRLAEAARTTARVWDLATGTVTHTFDLRHWYQRNVRLAFTPDGAELAVTRGELALFNLTDGTQRRVRTTYPLNDLAFSPDGILLLGAGATYHRWNVATTKALPRLKVPRDSSRFMVKWCPACAFTRDGTRLALSRSLSVRTGRGWKSGQEVIVYDTIADAIATQIEWTGREASRIAFSPDGAFIVAACGPLLRVWDVSTGTLVVEKQAGKSALTGLAFSPNGQYVATVSADRTTRLWEVGTWGEPTTFEWNVGHLRDVAFSPDGTTAAVASSTGKIVLFDVD